MALFGFNQPDEEEQAPVAKQPRPMAANQFDAALSGDPLAGESDQTFVARRKRLAQLGVLGPARVAENTTESARDQVGAARQVDALRDANEAANEDAQREARRAATDAEQAQRAAATAAERQQRAAAAEAKKAQAAKLRFLKDQGVQTQIAADGTEEPERHMDGALKFKPSFVSDPYQDPESGRFVRDYRDERGGSKIVDLEQNGDLHTDSETGMRYARGADGLRIDLGVDETFTHRETLKGERAALQRANEDDRLSLAEVKETGKPVVAAWREQSEKTKKLRDRLDALKGMQGADDLRKAAEAAWTSAEPDYTAAKKAFEAQEASESAVARRMRDRERQSIEIGSKLERLKLERFSPKRADSEIGAPGGAKSIDTRLLDARETVQKGLSDAQEKYKSAADALSIGNARSLTLGTDDALASQKEAARDAAARELKEAAAKARVFETTIREANEAGANGAPTERAEQAKLAAITRERQALLGKSIAGEVQPADYAKAKARLDAAEADARGTLDGIKVDRATAWDRAFRLVDDPKAWEASNERGVALRAIEQEADEWAATTGASSLEGTVRALTLAGQVSPKVEGEAADAQLARAKAALDSRKLQMSQPQSAAASAESAAADAIAGETRVTRERKKLAQDLVDARGGAAKEFRWLGYGDGVLDGAGHVVDQARESIRQSADGSVSGFLKSAGAFVTLLAGPVVSATVGKTKADMLAEQAANEATQLIGSQLDPAGVETMLGLLPEYEARAAKGGSVLDPEDWKAADKDGLKKLGFFEKGAAVRTNLTLAGAQEAIDALRGKGRTTETFLENFLSAFPFVRAGDIAIDESDPKQVAKRAVLAQELQKLAAEKSGAAQVAGSATGSVLTFMTLGAGGKALTGKLGLEGAKATTVGNLATFAPMGLDSSLKQAEAEVGFFNRLMSAGVSTGTLAASERLGDKLGGKLERMAARAAGSGKVAAAGRGAGQVAGMGTGELSSDTIQNVMEGRPAFDNFAASVGANYGMAVGLAMIGALTKARVGNAGGAHLAGHFEGKLDALRGAQAALDAARQKADPVAIAEAKDAARAAEAAMSAATSELLRVPGAVRARLASAIGSESRAVQTALEENPALRVAAVAIGRELRDAYLPGNRAEAARRMARTLDGFSGESSVPLADALVDQMVGATAARDLADVATGGKVLDDGKAKAFERLGLLAPSGASADGSVQWAVTEDGLPFLPEALRESIAAESGKFRVIGTGGQARIANALREQGEEILGTAARTATAAQVAAIKQAIGSQQSEVGGTQASVENTGGVAAGGSTTEPAQSPAGGGKAGKSEVGGRESDKADSRRFLVTLEREHKSKGKLSPVTLQISAATAEEAEGKARKQVTRNGSTVTGVKVEADSQAGKSEVGGRESGNAVDLVDNVDAVDSTQGGGSAASKAADSEIGAPGGGALDEAGIAALRNMGVTVTNKADVSVRVQPLPDGRLELNWNPAQSGADSALIQEELIHVASLISERQAWEKAGKPGTFGAWLMRRSVAIAADLKGWVAGLDDADRKTVEDGLQAAWNVYFSDFNDGSPAASLGEVWKQVEGSGDLAYGFVFESARMMVELRRKGEVRESTLLDFFAKLADWVRGALEAVRKLGTLQLGGSFGDLVAATEKQLAELEQYFSATGPAARSGAAGPGTESGSRRSEVGGRTGTLTIGGESVPTAGEWKAKNPRGREVFSGDWAVVPLRLLSINSEMGEAQDRSNRAETGKQQRAEIVANMTPGNIPLAWGESGTLNEGSPVVDERGSVEVGNNRTMALRDVLAGAKSDAVSAKAEAYRKFVEGKAGELGLSVPGEASVLVRVVRDRDGLTREAFVKEGNKAGTQRKSDVEEALSDATVLRDTPTLLAGLQPLEDGGLNSDFLASFYRALGAPEELRASDGGMDPAKVETRATRAMLARLFQAGEVPALDRVLSRIEKTDGIKRALGGVFQALPGLLKVHELNPELSIAGELGRALASLVEFRQAKAEGKVTTVDDFLSQGRLLGKTAEKSEVGGRKLDAALEHALLRMLAESKSVKAIGEALNGWVRRVEEFGDPDQVQMFAAEPPSKAELAGQLAGAAPAMAGKEVKKGSTQLTLSAAEAAPFVEYARSIPDADVYKPETEGQRGGYGREDEPHITALYGLTDVDPKAVAGVMKDLGLDSIAVRLGKTSLFENDEYDVLKVSVESPHLRRINQALRSLPHAKSDFPDYTPHLTIAYLKKGEGKKYAGDDRFAGKVLRFESLTVSDAERNKSEVSANGAAVRPRVGTTADAMPRKLQAVLAGKAVQVDRDAIAREAGDTRGRSGQRGPSGLVKGYFDAQDLPANVKETATREVAASFKEVQKLAEDEDLFAWAGRSRDAGRPGEVGTADAVSERAEQSAIARPLSAEARDVLAKRGILSSVIPRLLTREIPGFNVTGQVINRPADFAALLVPLRSPYFESLKVAFVDGDKRVVHSQVLHVGSLSESVAGIRDILSAMSEARRKNPNIEGALIAHNHPSGNPEPSAADRRITDQIKDALTTAGISLIDHVITNGKTFYSFTSQSTETMPDAKLAEWETVARDELMKVSGSDDLQRLVASLRQGLDDAETGHIVYVGTRGNVTAIERVRVDGQLTKALMEGIGREAPQFVMLDLSGQRDARGLVGRIQRALRGAMIQLMDVSTADHKSWAAAGMLSPGLQGKTLDEEQISQEAAATAAGREPVVEPKAPGWVRQMASDLYQRFLRGRKDALEHYAPGAKAALDDSEREAAFVRAGMRELVTRVQDDIRGALGTAAGGKKRVREFSDELLPTAARLNPTGFDAAGNYVFGRFNMRAGTLARTKAEASGLTTGQLWEERGEFLLVGDYLAEQKAFQLLRPMSPERQAAIYEAFHAKWDHVPDAMPVGHWLDSFIAPDLEDSRITDARGTVLPDFNRHALRAFFGEAGAWGELSEVAGYVPEVARTRSVATMAAGLVSNLLNKNFKSGAREYKSGEARERGQVRDLMQGFAIRAMEAHAESQRLRTAERLLSLTAKDVPPTGIPDGYVALNSQTITALGDAWGQAHGLTRQQLTDMSAALGKHDEAALKKLVGQAWAQLRADKMIRREVLSELVRPLAAREARNAAVNVVTNVVRSYTASLLSHPFTWIQNLLSNEIFKLMRVTQQTVQAGVMLAAGKTAGAKRSLREAWNVTRGMIGDRWFVPGARERLAEIVPRELFEGDTGIAGAVTNMTDDQKTVLDHLKQANVPQALLKAARYGEMDIRVKQQLAFAAYMASAEAAADAATKRGFVFKDRAQRVEWMKRWLREDAGPEVHRRARAVALAYAMDYGNVPAWLDNDTQVKIKGVDITPVANLVRALTIPFAKWPYNYARQMKRLAGGSLADVSAFVALKAMERLPASVQNAAPIAAMRGIASARSVSTDRFAAGVGNLATFALMTAFLSAWMLGDEEDKDVDKLGRSFDQAGKRLDSAFDTSSRVEVSDVPILGQGVRALARMFGEDPANNTYWLRVRTLPYASPMLLLASALGRGLGDENTGAYGRDFLGDFMSSGLGLRLYNAIRNNPDKWDEGKNLGSILGETAVDVALARVTPAPWLSTTRDLIDPVMRRSRPSRSLDYNPGFVEGVKSRIPGLSKSLPPSGQVRSAKKLENATEELAQLEAGGFKNASRVYASEETGEPLAALVDPETIAKVPRWRTLARLAGLNLKQVDRDGYGRAVRGEENEYQKQLRKLQGN